MLCRSFVARNLEHLVAGVHLWCWIYYDFAFIFPKKMSTIDSSTLLNSTSHGMMCLMLLWVLRSIIEVQPNQEFQLTRIHSFATFALPFGIHFVLSTFVIHRIDNELILPKTYEYIPPNWLKYVIRIYLLTFFAFEIMLFCRDLIGKYLTGKLEAFISTAFYFMLIFIIRIVFHLQISFD